MNRRHFLLTAVASTAVLQASKQAPLETRLVPESEPGEPLAIAGRIFDSDGRTPLAGGQLYLYHTDRDGYYSKPVSDPHHPRIHAWIAADDQGRYAFRTIWPGKYYDRDAPRHIHVHPAAQGIPEHWIDEFLFEGDPFIKREDVAKNAGLGRLSSIVHLEKDASGVLRGVRDIVLDRALVERNRVTK
jgi:protocatechuate 3,4-dioxygenase beta subunit